VLGGGTHDVIRQTALYLPAHHPTTRLARDLLAAALHLLTQECQAAEEVLQGLGIDAKEHTQEPYKLLADALRNLMKNEG
jgi:hypothetical protein